MKAWKKGVIIGLGAYLFFILVGIFVGWRNSTLFNIFERIMNSLFYILYPKSYDNPLLAFFIGFLQWAIIGAMVGDFIDGRKKNKQT